MKFLKGIGHHGEPLLMKTDKQSKEEMFLEWISTHPVLGEIKEINEEEYNAILLNNRLG